MESIIKKIKNNEELNPSDLEYFLNITRIYKDSNISIRSKSLPYKTIRA